ncbi:hypothetical protein KXS11_06065 [Plantibacter flavus]|uniref:hypothetical protein n=1 Tax=Plantibacter flavus TaxID=150123 RepID=UPI003F18B236
MEFSWLYLIAAFGGGMFGAAVGAVPAFVLAGVAAAGTFAFSTITGTQPDLGLTPLSGLGPFGPWLSPNIAFAGGVAAAAYAARIGRHGSGNDTVSSLAGLQRPDVLLVGGLFGAFGYAVEWVCTAFSPTIAGTILFTPVVTAIVVSNLTTRLVFGRTGLFGKPESGVSRWQPTLTRNWVPWQERPTQVLVIGIAMALPVAYLVSTVPSLGFDLPLAISATWLLFLTFGFKTPVAHHATLGAAIGVLLLGDFFWGAAVGICGALIGEIVACVFQYHGDTAIDPPSVALLILWLVIAPLAPMLGEVSGLGALLLGAAAIGAVYVALVLLKRGTTALPTPETATPSEIIAA